MAADFLNPETLEALRLMFDTAALVLIWLVQLVIYPAFVHFQQIAFKQWHLVYTRRVTMVVLPIMLGQLAVYGGLLLTAASWGIWLNAGLVLAVWAITFLRAVPLHGALDLEEDHLPLSLRLIAVNWWRTGLWSICWAITVASWWLGAH